MSRLGRPLRRRLAACALVALCATPTLALADESDPACFPPTTSIGWSQPKAVPISADGAVRWPLDATLRVAYGGMWCPDGMRVSLARKDDSAGVPTEVLGQNALPPGASIKPELSLIMGAGEQWVGRVVADLGRDTVGAFRFFLDTYHAQG